MNRKTYDELYKELCEFRVAALILKRGGWSDEDIVNEWYEIQEDDEAGDYDVP
jgi:hypothetical protein